MSGENFNISDSQFGVVSCYVSEFCLCISWLSAALLFEVVSKLRYMV